MNQSEQWKDQTGQKWENTRLKNKIENNLIGEGAFYQSEWVKIIYELF